MKTSSYLSRAANIVSLGALVVFAGCADVPLRRSTLALEAQSATPVTAVDRPGFEVPTTLRTVLPEHPWEAKRLGIPGEVEVVVAVDEAGRVIDAQVANSTFSMYEETTLTAVKQWTFRPALQDGVAVPSRICIPFWFQFSN